MPSFNYVSNLSEFLRLAFSFKFSKYYWYVRTVGRFYSKNLFIFKYFNMNVKLMPNKLVGVVAAYYISHPL